jgi:hypothetical protein
MGIESPASVLNDVGIRGTMNFIVVIKARLADALPNRLRHLLSQVRNESLA